MRPRCGVPAAVVLGVLATVLAGCVSGPILANPQAPLSAPASPAPAPASPVPAPARHADPVPIVFPRDDGPHDRLTEWWYYTGHLRSADGRTFGFQLVVFRAERGGFPVSWASHVAITDEEAGRFHYAQRLEIGPQVDHSTRAADGAPAGFDLRVMGLDPTRPETAVNPLWTMAGALGHDRIAATLSPDEATIAGAPGGMALDLALTTDQPPALHQGSGYVDFGPAGGSYYYSRTRMGAKGSVVVDGLRLDVTGTAWFDHQWGDFIAVGAGGWDWFGVNLADGTNLQVNEVRAADGSHPFVYGTLVAPDGSTRNLAVTEISVDVLGRWTSSRTGAMYPSGWRVRIADEGLDITLRPTVAAQELDTRATTGVVYWEGSEQVAATHDGWVVAGDAYVELTGYAPAAGGGGAP